MASSRLPREFRISIPDVMASPNDRRRQAYWSIAMSGASVAVGKAKILPAKKVRGDLTAVRTHTMHVNNETDRFSPRRRL